MAKRYILLGRHGKTALYGDDGARKEAPISAGQCPVDASVTRVVQPTLSIGRRGRNQVSIVLGPKPLKVALVGQCPVGDSTPVGKVATPNAGPARGRTPQTDADRPLSKNDARRTGGVWETLEVAAALRQECESPSAGEQVSIGEIWNGGHRCTKETAGHFADILNTKVTAHGGEQAEVHDLQPIVVEELTPENFRSQNDPGTFAATLRSRLEELKSGNAILLVGHEPQLGRLQHVLTGRSMPLRNSGVVCIEIDGAGKGRIVWVLSPSGDDKTLRELQQKIRSKMATAKLLGAVISALLGFSLAALIEKDRFEHMERMQTTGVMKVAVGFLFAGLGLYLLTMFAYDRLLMPVSLWTHDKQSKRPAWLVARPPSAATYVLYLNMMHIWDWLFTPATWAVVLGLLCLAWAAFAPSRLLDLPQVNLGKFGQWFVDHSEPSIGMMMAIVVAFLYWKGQPVLGSRD